MGLKIYNLEKDEYEIEPVCAEASMRFLYSTKIGSAALFALVARAAFSRLCGVWANSKLSARAIEDFAKNNKINLGEAERSVDSFATFNEFFSRALKASARPVAKSGGAGVLFPCDGRHLLVRNVSQADSFYAKGQSFNLKSFFGDGKLADRFAGGDMLISRLSPLDYHRFHFPVSGAISARRLIDGMLFSVSPLALVPRLSVLWENKRVLNIIETEDFGMCAFVEIGATNVGTIVNFRSVGECASAGECAGLFKLGASCVVTVFPPSVKIDWNAKLAEMSAENIECFARANGVAGLAEK